MRNLKRALSFALACVMLVGMMVVGTSAAFADDADIVNTEAAEMLVALNIVNGKPGNKFDPTGIVTRGEMAKMICVAMNGGKDPKLTEGGMYPDTKNHWARGYIDYCTNLGVVAGDTAGNFNPDKTVTGTEAAKMILIALGFNAENEKFVNDANWATNINVRAAQKELYNGLDILPSAGLTRDAAAQMIWNGVNADMVYYEYVLNTVNGNLVSLPIAYDRNYDILEKKFDLEYSAADVLIGTETAALGTANYTEEGKSKLNTLGEIDFAVDPALLGEEVKVLYKDADGEEDLDATEKIYGVVTTGKTKVYEVAAMKKLEAGDASLKIDEKTTLTNITAAKIFVNGAAASAVTDVFTANAGTAPATTTTMKVVAGEDKVVDYVIVTKKALEQVTAITAEKIAFSTTGTQDLEDVKGAEGLAKNDYVLTYTENGVIYVEPVTAKTVEVTAKTGGHLVSNGKTIKLDGFITNATGKTNVTVSGMTFNSNYDLYMVGSTYALALATKETEVKDYALVIDAKNSTAGAFGSDAKVQLLLADGTKPVYALADNKVEGQKVDGSELDAATLKDKLYTYVVADGKVELKAAGANITLAANYAGKNELKGTTATYFLNDDAVVYQYVTDAWKVYSGADYAKDHAAMLAGDTMAVIAKTTGLKNISVVVLADQAQAAPSETDDTVLFGYVTAGASVRKSGTTYYTDYTVWNGEETITVTEKMGTSEGTPNATMKTKGNFVSYQLKSDGTLDASTVAAVSNVGAVTAIDGNKVVVGGTDIYNITSDTVVIYVDTEDMAGVEIGSVMVKDAITGNDNVKWVLGTGTKAKDFKVLFVDVDNDITR